MVTHSSLVIKRRVDGARFVRRSPRVISRVRFSDSKLLDVVNHFSRRFAGAMHLITIVSRRLGGRNTKYDVVVSGHGIQALRRDDVSSFCVFAADGAGWIRRARRIAR